MRRKYHTDPSQKFQRILSSFADIIYANTLKIYGKYLHVLLFLLFNKIFTWTSANSRHSSDPRLSCRSFLHLFADTLYTSVARSKVGDWRTGCCGCWAAQPPSAIRRVSSRIHADAARRDDLPAPACANFAAPQITSSRRDGNDVVLARNDTASFVSSRGQYTLFHQDECVSLIESDTKINNPG